MPDQYYVYGHINPITKKFFYIGKGKGNRLHSSFGRNNFWHNTVTKHGFFSTKLVDGLTELQAFEIERQYIFKHGLKSDGGTLVNLTYGGEGTSGCRHSEESRKKRSCIIVSDVTRLKIKESKIGIRNPNYNKKTWNFGVPRTEEEKIKISQSKSGVKQSEVVKIKSLAALKLAQKAITINMQRVECMATFTVWKNRRDCLIGLGISLNQFKERIRTDRGRQNLKYLKN